jgi:hypothetical protein
MHHDEHVCNVRILREVHGSLPLCCICGSPLLLVVLSKSPLWECRALSEAVDSFPSPLSFYHRTFLGTFAGTSSFSSRWNPNNLPKIPPGFGTGHSRASSSNIFASSWNWRNNAASSSRGESFLFLVGARALSSLPAAAAAVIRVGSVDSCREATEGSTGCSRCSSPFLRFRRTIGRPSESSCRSVSA